MGQPPDTVATTPSEVDAIIREAWSKIYNGNVADIEAHVKDFVESTKTISTCRLKKNS